jgi:hypothetical protein
LCCIRWLFRSASSSN